MRPDIEAIRKRANAATPGPWYVETIKRGVGCRVKSRGTVSHVGNPNCRAPALICALHFGLPIRKTTPAMDRAVTNFGFIAHARADIHALLAYIAELEGRLGIAPPLDGGEDNRGNKPLN